MIRNLIFFLHVFFLIPCVCFSQKPLAPDTVCILPKELNESSSLEMSGENLFWSLNDHGGKAEIIGFNQEGKIIRQVSIQGILAEDFEAMAKNDLNGDLFIGDIGNNANIRFDLCVYRLKNPENVYRNKVLPYKISFYYPDQAGFPPPYSAMNFDCEAMIYFKDSLYLFSKNRSGNHMTKCYSLPAYPGTEHDTSQTIPAILLDSIELTRWITSADISPDGNKLALLSESRMWLFYDFPGSEFFKGKKLEILFGNYTQKEGVVFYDDNIVYITDEKLIDSGGMMYKLDLSEIFR